MGIGIFTKSTAEYAKRGEDFSKVQLAISLLLCSHIHFARRSAPWLSKLLNTCSSQHDVHAAQELDFVLANVIMALVADFMLVWLPAPTLSFK